MPFHSCYPPAGRGLDYQVAAARGLNYQVDRIAQRHTIYLTTQSTTQIAQLTGRIARLGAQVAGWAAAEGAQVKG